MALQDLIAAAVSRIRIIQGKTPSPFIDLDNHRITQETEREALANAASSDLARIVLNKQGRTVDKWLHYPEVYERHFSRFRNKPLRMLEIGVFRGGSLEMWREYFGPQAMIFGVDINSDCASFVDAPNQVRIGSQDSPDFLRSVVQEMGGVDIILDDGSHIARHQRASFDILFPLLAEGGLYAIEDMHTSYWPGGYEGGIRRAGTAIEMVKDLVDDMHGWYHNETHRRAPKDQVKAVHIYDSISIVEKAKVDRPRSIRVGGNGCVVVD
jgi:hypothetical protein